MIEAAMANFKEFRFRIEGSIDGVDITPLTLPMARLAEYLSDLALIMGHKESVHFMGTDDGSAQSVMYVDEDEEAQVTSQIQNAARGMGPRKANEAYKRVDVRLREDNAVGNIVNASKSAEIIEFPGRRADLPHAYGPINERASIVGVLKRVGGFDESIPVHLQRADGVIFHCQAAPSLAKELIGLYERTIRVHGIATYYREQGLWKLEKFRIQSYDPQPLADESIFETLQKLRAIPDNEWNQIEDPLGELRKLRHGEDVRP